MSSRVDFRIKVNVLMMLTSKGGGDPEEDPIGRLEGECSSFSN